MSEEIDELLEYAEEENHNIQLLAEELGIHKGHLETGASREGEAKKKARKSLFLPDKVQKADPDDSRSDEQVYIDLIQQNAENLRRICANEGVRTTQIAGKASKSDLDTAKKSLFVPDRVTQKFSRNRR